VKERLSEYNMQILENLVILTDVYGAPLCLILCGLLIELGCGVSGAIVCTLACGSTCDPSGPGFPVCAVVCGSICAAMVITICYLLGVYGVRTDSWGICCMI
jgi:hypothetical protein